MFTTSIAIADPRLIVAGATLTSTPIAVITDARLAENYEGVAVQQDADGMSLWLVSDDNMQDWQRSRLLRFRIDPAALGAAKRAAPLPARP
ncbi:MAG: esterase-like activity of phytase family protein [Sphingopyxis sp.]|nr:esterase-like activity of phytase family protein [Sphingopyxis sp.]